MVDLNVAGEETAEWLRVAEPELMLGEEQALAYAGADLTEINQTIVTEFGWRFRAARISKLLDLGCGAADVAIRFARAYPQLQVVGVDASDAMLRCAQSAVEKAGLADRVTLQKKYLPDHTLGRHQFDAITANSLLHHLNDPAALWRTVKQCAAPGAAVMVVDLRRPGDSASADRLLEKYGAEAAPILRLDFFNSLRAAYTAEEIRIQLDDEGLAGFKVVEIGELHVVVWGVAP